jgi:hypothetical protein
MEKYIAPAGRLPPRNCSIIVFHKVHGGTIYPCKKGQNQPSQRVCRHAENVLEMRGKTQKIAMTSLFSANFARNVKLSLGG